MGRLTNITDKNGEQIITQLEYTYDAAGNISDTSDTIGVTIDGIESATMQYDSANRLISYNGEQITYDADGNMTYAPLAGIMTTFKYDCRNRLIQAGNATFKYDAENNRIEKTEDGINTNYVVENAAQLSRIFIEETGTNKTYYTYGNGLISQEKTGEQSPESHGILYYHFNNIGSTVAVTDTSGEIIERFNYGTYGELQSENQTGITFLYNGEYGVVTDNNGLYYMRARYYNTAIRRFINEDPIKDGDNWYVFVGGNPVLYVDPSGNAASTPDWAIRINIKQAFATDYAIALSYNGQTKDKEILAAVSAAKTMKANAEANGIDYSRVYASASSELSIMQQLVNASYIYMYLLEKNWTEEAICGLLGNIQQESKFNPGAWQDSQNISSGYGLVQFDPDGYNREDNPKDTSLPIGLGKNSFLTWLHDEGNSSITSATGLDKLAKNDPKKLMDLELEYLIWSSNPKNSIWIKTKKYNSPYEMSYNDYINSYNTPGNLALVFHAHYERSNDTEEGYRNRAGYATGWYYSCSKIKNLYKG